MTKRAFDRIKSGLDDARAYLKETADKQRYKVHVPEKTGTKTRRAATARPPLTTARRRSGA